MSEGIGKAAALGGGQIIENWGNSPEEENEANGAIKKPLLGHVGSRNFRSTCSRKKLARAAGLKKVLCRKPLKIGPIQSTAPKYVQESVMQAHKMIENRTLAIFAIYYSGY